MTTHEPLRPPVEGTDDRGRRVYRVRLANLDVWATIYPEDYEALIASGVSPSWSWATPTKQVVARVSGGGVKRISRLMLGEPEGFLVCHRNRNALDLRRENIFAKPIRTYPQPDFTGKHHPI